MKSTGRNLFVKGSDYKVVSEAGHTKVVEELLKVGVKLGILVAPPHFCFCVCAKPLNGATIVQRPCLCKGCISLLCEQSFNGLLIQIDRVLKEGRNDKGVEEKRRKMRSTRTGARRS